MIFKTINSKVEKPNYTINIQNIDASGDHWGSERDIIEYLTMFENALYEPDTLNDSILTHALTLARVNRRIKNLSFYRIPEENRIVFLARTDIFRFKEPEILSREMSISFNKHKFALSIIELLESEEKILNESKTSFPEKWKFDDTMNKRYGLMSTFLYV